MSLLVDILTGQLFKFKTAAGTDIIAGTSSTLIVTPLALHDAGLLNTPIVGLPITVSGEITVASATLLLNTPYGMVPDIVTGLLPAKTGSSFTAKLYAVVKADSGAAGEVSLVDGSTGSVISGTAIDFNNTTYQVMKSADFTLAAGKYFTFGIKKTSGGLFTNAYIRAALLTLR